MQSQAGIPSRATALKGRIDLHTHTNASDGTLAPEELLQRAFDHQIAVLSITDHDSTEGYTRVAAMAAQRPGFTLIPGIEMSAEGENPCHILGYGIRVNDPVFQSRLEALRVQRIARIQAMVDRLRSLDIPITMALVREQTKGGAMGRPHIADALIALKVVKKRQEAFDRFLKRDGIAYVETPTPTAQETLALIRDAGGISVLAHPSRDTSENLIKRLVEWGLMGIEAYYPEHSRSLIEHYRALAAQYGLITTGGSDYHGPRTGRPRLACVDVPSDALEILQNRLRVES